MSARLGQRDLKRSVSLSVSYALLLSLSVCTGADHTVRSSPSDHPESDIQETTASDPQISEEQEQLIRDLGSENEEVSIRAENALEQLDRTAVPILLQALTGESKKAHYLAAHILGRIKDPRAVEPLIWALKVSTALSRKTAAWALGEIGDVRAVSPLLKTLKDAEADVRARAVRALPKADQQGQAFPQFIVAYQEEKNKNVLEEYMWGLYEYTNTPSAYPAIIEGLKHSDGRVRYFAAKVVQEAADFSGGKGPTLRKLGAVEPLLVVFRTDNIQQVRRKAAEALGTLGDIAVLEPLLARLKGSSPSEETIIALGKIAEPGDSRVLHKMEILLTVREDNEPYYGTQARIAAAEVLAKLGRPQDQFVVNALFSGIQDPSEKVRHESVMALGKLARQGSLVLDHWSGPEVVKVLQPFLAHPDERIQLGSARILAGLGNSGAVEVLIPFLEDGNSYYCEEAAKALGQLGDVRAIGPLYSALIKKKNVGCRDALGGGLGHLDHPLAIDHLDKALNNENQYVSLAAAYGLAVAGNSRGLNVLFAALGSDEEHTRWIAGTQLGKLKDPAVVKGLLENSQNLDSEGAISLVGRLAGVEGIAPLIRVLTRKTIHRGADDYMALQALRALGKIANRCKPVIQAYKSGDSAVIASLSSDERSEGIQVLSELADLLSHPEEKARLYAFDELVFLDAFEVITLPDVPEQAHHYMEQGLAVFSRAKTKEDVVVARDRFERAVNLAPWWADARYNLALVHEELGENEKAGTELEYYLKIRPDAEDADPILAKISSLKLKS